MSGRMAGWPHLTDDEVLAAAIIDDPTSATHRERRLAIEVMAWRRSGARLAAIIDRLDAAAQDYDAALFEARSERAGMPWIHSPTDMPLP